MLNKWRHKILMCLKLEKINYNGNQNNPKPENLIPN